MKALRSISAVLGAVMILSVSAYADHDRYGRGGYERGGYYGPRHIEVSHYNHGNWIIPLMIGGVLGYTLSEPRRESVTYIQPVQPQIMYQSQPIYQEQWVYFNDCDCQRKVLVQVR